MKTGNLTAHEGEAGAGLLGGRIEVEAERSADVDMVLDFKVKLARGAPTADFNIFRLILADRHAFVREVRNAEKHVVETRANVVEFGLKFREFFGNLGGFSHQGGSVLTVLLGHADLTGEHVALLLQIFGLDLHGLAGSFKFVEFLFREHKVARRKAGNHFRELLAQHRQVKHCFYL